MPSRSSASATAPALRHLFEEYQPDAVINLAAESHVDRSIDGPGEFIQTNVVGTFTLLQETLRYWRSLSPDKRKNFRFLHVSTDEVFGSLGDEGFFTEATAYAPNSPYSASKASSDHLVRAWRETYELPTLVTNCSNNYGPYHRSWHWFVTALKFRHTITNPCRLRFVSSVDTDLKLTPRRAGAISAR